MSVLLVPCKFLVRSTTCCIRAILLRTRGGGFLHGHVGKYTQGVSATPPPRWTITPLFYSRSTDLPVLRGRRRVDGDDARRRTELHYSGSVGEVCFQKPSAWACIHVYYMYVYINIYILYIYGFLVCRYARSLGLTARQITPATDGAI